MSSRQSPRLAASGRGSASQPGAMRRRRAAPRKGPVSRQEVVQLIKKNAGETKYFDCGINNAQAASGGDWSGTEVPCDNTIDGNGAVDAYTFSSLIPSMNGAAYGQVVGNRYYLKKLRVRGHVTTATISDQADAATSRHARLLLVMDTQPNGAQAQGEDVMMDMGAANETEYSFKRVTTTSSRFRILKDQFIVVKPVSAINDNDPTGAVSTGSIAYDQVPFSFQYQPRKPIQVNITSGNSEHTVAGLVNCNIFLLMYCPTTNMTIVAASRCYYQD